MSDQSTEPTAESAEPTPQERLDAALAEFQQLAKMMPPGMPPLALPPILELTASVNALAATLIEQGTLDEEGFLSAKLSQMADMTEQCVLMAREVKRQALGLVVAGQIPEI